MAIKTDILYTLAMLIYMHYNVVSFYYASQVLKEFNKKPLLIYGVAILNTVFLILSYTVYSPYYLSYVSALIMLTVEFYFLSKAKIKQAFFAGVTFVVQIICMQMSVIAIMSDVLKIAPLDMLINKDLFSLNIIFTFILAEILMVVFKKMIQPVYIKKIIEHEQQVVMISAIGAFVILYNCIDSLMLLEKIKYSNFTLTILSITILSSAVFYLLLLYGLKIIKMEHFKLRANDLENKLREKLKTEEKLKIMAFKDNLTGCYAKSYIMEQLDLLLCKKQDDFSLVYIDLDGLKVVNDKFGHNEGDIYICNVSRCIAHSLRENDLFARMGGDEFMIILPKCNQENADLVMQRAQMNLMHIKKEKINYSMSISYGIVHVDNSLMLFTKEDLIEIADKKMYESKEKKGDK